VALLQKETCSSRHSMHPAPFPFPLATLFRPLLLLLPYPPPSQFDYALDLLHNEFGTHQKVMSSYPICQWVMSRMLSSRVADVADIRKSCLTRNLTSKSQVSRINESCPIYQSIIVIHIYHVIHYNMYYTICNTYTCDTYQRVVLQIWKVMSHTS